MKLIYSTTVTGVGEKAVEFFRQGMFVIFKDDAPEYLKEFCIIHNGNEFYTDVQSKDLVKIGDEKFSVTSVGCAVNDNLRDLGHITFRFDGVEDLLPGSLGLEKKDVPEIKKDMKIEIWRL